jgi:acetolactate synthase I/II/III large subunit
LVQENIKYVFGVTGKAISPFLDAILDYPDIAYISSKHESGAALMAFGYAQGSGNIGVCCATTGGGSTNLATGVATAYMNSIPLLVFTGQVSTFEFGKGAFQESTGFVQSIHTVDFFKPITKESLSIINPKNVAETIRYAIRSATSGRMGPVHINIPFDIQQVEVEFKLQSREKKYFSGEIYDEDSPAMKETLALIDEAKKPVFLVGWGGVLSGANKEIIELAEKLKIPVATTVQGKGAIPTNHPLCLGIIGLCGHPIASKYIFEQCDLLIVIGTSLGEFTTFNWDERFLKINKIIQIDIDNREIGKNYPVHVGITGDANVIARRLKEMIYKSDIEIKQSGNEIINLIKTKGLLVNTHLMDDNSIPIKPQRLMKAIRDHAPADTIFLADSGSHWAWAMHYLSIGKGGNFFPTIGLGAMGASICSAIGVKISKPETPVICICGDGSFLMSGNEIATAEQFNVPVIWIILNDSRYNLPEFSIKKMFNRKIGVKLSETNFSKLAEAYNVKGYRVENPNELSRVLTEALALNKPVVIDVVIDPDEIPPIGQRKLIVSN